MKKHSTTQAPVTPEPLTADALASIRGGWFSGYYLATAQSTATTTTGGGKTLEANDRMGNFENQR